MKKIARVLPPILVLTAIGSGAGWWHYHHSTPDGLLTVYGNVDLRQASVPFNGTERIAEVLVEEGHLVHQGQLLARLDTSRLQPQLEQSIAAVEAQKAVVERLHNGNRPEEIAQARANLVSAKADAENTNAQYLRRKALVSISAVSQQDVDVAKAADDVAIAKVAVAQKALELEVIGPRAEDIAQAEAQLHGNEAQLALLRQQLADAELRAPFDAVVRSRLMEPGEMASPSKPVFSLATLGTKWVRAYVPESNLGQLHEGEQAKINIDSLPDRSLEGWVGFISPVAEFTPKAVQTEDLRTSLVYEVRIFVTDTNNVLRLGMPATVQIMTEASKSASTAPAQ
ncbi:MAG TPA: efflux RND transporter periplasmic adaptor subunit [Candidatus Sulfotelmatobacter sp.]|jgi:HlyD family secretion protein|nr:efflux RND transporter periplasmic adaptor subunit [Candidatus Sulfotelmatobacter sp.]